MCKISLISFLTLLIAGTAMAAGSVSTSGKVKTKIRKSISLTKDRDLDFGNSLTGDPLAAIAPGSLFSASFTVSGSPSTAYSIALPTSITMTKGNGVGLDRQIQVTKFKSLPSLNGQLNAIGKATLSVGATRAAIRPDQDPGAYAASFLVVVTYQ